MTEASFAALTSRSFLRDSRDRDSSDCWVDDDADPDADDDADPDTDADAGVEPEVVG